MKVIFHLDLDSYFVSAQRTIQPDLIGKPVIVSAGRRRSMIIAASYEAKALGIKIPMPFYEAKEIAPNLINIFTDFSLYTLLSTKMFELISNKITNKIQVASIDEAYIDVSDVWQKYGSPTKLAKHIQQLILKELKLPVSIGIANNLFVAKMSTQVNKPFGITVTKPGDFMKVFGDWKTGKVHGIGAPTEKVLLREGIHTIKELSELDPKRAEDILGARGKELLLNVNENGNDQVDLSLNDLKGIGNSMTFMDKDRDIRSEILEIILHLSKTISIRLKNRNMGASVISVAIKKKGGPEIKAKRKQITLKRPISSEEEVYREAIRIFDDIWDEGVIKFIGIHTSKLTDMFDNMYQQSLFDGKTEKSKIDDILANINGKHGHKTVVSLKEGSENIKKKQNQSRYIEGDRVIGRYEKKD